MATVCNRGYVVPKQSLNAQEKKKIIKDLTMVKESHYVQPQHFKIYQETKDEFILPVDYALNNLNCKYKIEYIRPEPIDVKDNIQLRPEQLECFDVCSKANRGIINLSTGSGKCLAYDTGIMMYSGIIKKVQDIVVGDTLMGDDSTPRKVVSLARGHEEMYEVEEYCGESYTVNKSHVLSLKNTIFCHKKNKIITYTWLCPYKYTVKSRSFRDNDNNHVIFINLIQKVIDIPISKYLKLTSTQKSYLRGYRPSSVKFEKGETLPLDPYLVGFLVVTFNLNGKYMQIRHHKVQHYLLHELRKYDMLLEFNSENKLYEIVPLNKSDPSQLIMNALELDEIPHAYKCSSKKNRLKLLAGILDAKGYKNIDGGYNLYIKHSVLYEDIDFVVRSLGFGIKTVGIQCKLIQGKMHKIPLLCNHLKQKKENNLRDVSSYNFQVHRKGYEAYYGFEITGNRRFLLKDFTVTHNTVVSLKLFAHFKTKTLVIVDKNELLNQWTREINRFVPSVRIGIIQGSKCDIQSKDIVLCMLQTLSKRNSIDLTSFGLCFVDEVHGTSTKVFSNALMKAQPQRIFGLTATMKRQDNLEIIYQHFIGKMVYSNIDSGKKQKTQIFIHKYHGISSKSVYLWNDPSKIAHSTILTNLAKDTSRTEFLFNLLRELTLDKTRHVLVVSDRTMLLKNLHKKLSNSGLFIGEIAQEERNLTMNEKQIILGTYQIAGVAFSCKRLNTLVFGTPRPNVTQAIGRIYRQEHKNVTPIIVDIVDEIPYLINQHFRRKKIYRKEIKEVVFKGNDPFKEEETLEFKECMILSDDE